MAKNLVIVESPAKAKTLGKYLGRNYTVKASVGHVVDLPKSKLGVDIANDFKPDYAVIHGKSKVIDELKKAAKDKENIYLAPDPDREGEAIAWHIAERLGNKKNIHRVLFNEITKKAVQEAIKHPLELDRAKFDAQQARRVLDRLVGYQLSPLLWDKVRRGLSAGRVQSVAVRLITERERAIRAFVKEEYWTIAAALEGDTPPPVSANLFELAGKRLDHKTFRLENEAAATGVVEHLEGADWVVAKVEKSDRKRNPSPPFITSRLQQEASRKLGYQPRRTMGIAQKLYEGVEIGDEGAVGLITYMRTDSTRLSPDAIEAVRGYIGTPLWCRLRPREAARLQVQEEYPGRPRGDPPDQHRVPARAGRGLSREGRAQSLHAHLEPLRRLSDGAGASQGDDHRHRRQGRDLPRDRPGGGLRRVHAGLHRGRRRRRSRTTRTARRSPI